MELAAHDDRPVPREASRKQVRSNGTGAIANPAEAVPTTRAAKQTRHFSMNGLAKPITSHFAFNTTIETTL